MRLLVAGVLLGACSVAALAQSVTTYGYDVPGRLTTLRGGIGVRPDYGLDAADNRSAYHSTPQFPYA